MAVITMMPAMMLLIRSLVWTSAVVTPAAAPASTAAPVARNGLTRATSSAATTAPPSG